MSFNGYEVNTSQGSLMENNFDIFNDYNDIHDLLSHSSLRQLEQQRPDLLLKLQFTIAHGNMESFPFANVGQTTAGTARRILSGQWTPSFCWNRLATF
ncbi:hypothetical protein HOLleu_18915 [Holothuria leucospilota]|uniref:Uncharacterized protein n=1 Tax=Holothuria leucospilota TaxID=206669 RepID=A0A9Q1C3H8_HOLLE|nr:hypothetical protein HOLleu_18915 [Holothuria leucospilota]